jgi:hypothetical protein
MSYIGQAPGQGQAERFLFTPSGTGTAVTADDDGVSIGYTVGQVSVYLNGVKQVIGSGKDVTATDGSTITFLAAYAASDVIEIIALSAFSPSNTVAATGGTFSGNVIVGATSGNQTLDVASHDLVDGGLKLAGTLVTASATEINLLDGLTSVGSTSITDNGNAVAMTIDTDENVTYTGNIIMPTNKKVQQKGAFMQSSTHQALTLGA